MKRRPSAAVQERRLCAYPGCGKAVRRPRGAASLCAAGHPVPATQLASGAGQFAVVEGQLTEQEKADIKEDWRQRYSK